MAGYLSSKHRSSLLCPSRENINYRDFNWIRGWFIVTLRDRGCEKTACTLSFQPWEAASEFILALCITATGEGCQRFWAHLPPGEAGAQPSFGCRVEFWSVKSPSGGEGRERGHTPHTVLKSHSRYVGGVQQLLPFRNNAFTIIFPLK